MRITKPNSQTILILALVGVVLLAGCSGLGNNSPANDDDSNDNESDDLEETDDEAGSDSNDGESNGNETDETGESDDVTEDGQSEDDQEQTDDNRSSEEDNNDSEGETDTGNESSEDGDAQSGDENESGTSDDESDDNESKEEYASPDEIQVEGVTHMESDSSLDHDEITLANTNDERALPIGGWEIEVSGQDERVTIEDGAVIEPGGTYTVALEDGEKTLSEDGGQIQIYDANGNQIDSWDHIGSPSAPSEGGEDTDVGYVQFTVTDAATGNAIEDAEVVLTNENDETYDGSTDGAGVTTVRNIPHGEYDLTVTHDEYTEHTETITISEEGTEMSIELEPSENEGLQVQPPVTIDTASA